MADSGMSIVVVAAGADRDDAISLAGLARNLAGESGSVHALATGDGDDARALGGMLATALKTVSPDVVLVPDTPTSRTLAALVADSLDGGILTRCVSVARTDGGFEVACAMYGGVARARYRLCAGEHPWVLAVDSHAVADTEDATPPVPVLDVDAPPTTSRVRVVSRQARQPSGLAGARVVVTGGGGLRSEADYRRVEQLAALLGGVAGASKPAVVRGWARAEQKVGLTGARVAPDVYIALGVSGASQHMAGCARARVVVAVNLDRRAPIFAHATYGVVADANSLLPILIDAVREAVQPAQTADAR